MNRLDGYLRCSAFEELMMMQDSPAYPCVICVRLELSSRLDRDRFHLAIDRWISRHPLLGALLETRWGRDYWRLNSAESARCVRWFTQEEPPAWPDQYYINLYQRCGLSIDVYQADAEACQEVPGCVVLMQVHHALSDGLGCLQAVHDLLAIYQAVDGQTELALPKLEPHKLKQRNFFGLTMSKVCQLLPRQLVGLAGVRQYLMRRPVPLAGYSVELKKSLNAESSIPIEVSSFRCSRELTQALRYQARFERVTLNDLLTACIFDACAQYRQQQTPGLGVDQEQQWLRIMVPMNLRDAQSDETQSACNIVSCVFLDRTGHQIGDRPALLKGIHDEMQLIKHNRLALLFIWSLWVRKMFSLRFKRGPRRAVWPGRCPTSLVFSNMGKLFDSSPYLGSDQRLTFGDVTVERCDVLAPLAPMVGVAITVGQYAGQLTFCLRYDPRVIQPSQAHELRQLISQRIEQNVPQVATR
ncbi:MAG: DUF1298 domain-containing protein [Pirellulaceae bacterium]|nr:DUF1298 domain-containing protein [Pirellulaceae bacterium]